LQRHDLTAVKRAPQGARREGGAGWHPRLSPGQALLTEAQITALAKAKASDDAA
jgi:hypothetical protein